MNYRSRLFWLAAIVAAGTTAASAITPLWLRDVKLSPDGKEIAFTYKGDIYKVPVSGGSAVRLTSQPSYESRPIWSPDSRKIAFASDREGGSDIFIMPSNGGSATRLTYNSVRETPQAFTPDGKNVVFTANIQAPASSVWFPSNVNTQLYEVSAEGGRPRQILALPVNNVSYKGDKGAFLYEDVKGSEDEWRKHHVSSVTRDIWLYDPATSTHTNLTDHAGEDRDAVASPSGDRIYFLSERDGGSMNVYSFDPASPAVIRRETNFKTHPVRFLSVAPDNTLVFTYNGEIYTKAPQGQPRKVAIDVIPDDNNSISKISFSSPSKVVASPDGKQIAFINRGEVFVGSPDYSTVKQVTHTPEGECDLVWGKDSRELYYVSERDGRFNIWRASIVRDEDPNFANATLVKEERIFDNDRHERTNPQLSPDGKKLAYVEDRNNLMVYDLDSKKSKKLTNATTTTSRAHGFNVEWSPDSKWLLLEACDYRHEPYTDIVIINAENGDFHKITASGYFDESPHWVMDGNAVIFLSERYGMRNHASWGSEYDVMIAFMNQDAYDKFRLSEEDYSLLKEVEKQQAKKKDDKKEGDKEKADKEDEKLIVIETEGLGDRIIRLTPNSSSISDAMVSKDGKSLYYLSSTERGYDLWKKNLRKGDVKMVSKLNGPAAAMQLLNHGEIYLLDSPVSKHAPSSDKLHTLSFKGTMDLDREAERNYMLEYVRREARERFYVPDMGGVDWEAYVDNYARFMPHISNNYDFQELLSELLGELNVSHSGGRYGGTAARRATASLGLLYDMTYQGPGLKVNEAIAKGPFDRATTALVKGSVITAINGNTLTDNSDPLVLLNDMAGKKTLVAFTNPDGSKHEEVVLPVSISTMSSLLYDRWVKAREKDVEQWSKGRLGYVHIAAMSDPSFRNIYSKILGEYVGKDGIVIDTRWNGGGRMHEDIEVMFSGDKYLTQEVHGRKSGDMPSRRWNKPSIMVIGEANYSNAHGTPWVYSHQGLGKLVGMPVPGTMSSVNWITMQDPSMIFGVPVIGFKTAEGNYLENTQLEPDVKVALDKVKSVEGVDNQLKKAVETLLNDIDAAK
ncbi:MAG: peptidase S41 [Paramuribaculum sp.]|nr:peptidase S41 [Paramuribaculum sp.]